METGHRASQQVQSTHLYRTFFTQYKANCPHRPSVELLRTKLPPRLSKILSMMLGTAPSAALNARGVAKYSDFGHIEGYISETVRGKFVLITNRKSYMSFRLVPKLVTLNDLERPTSPYFALFHRIFVYDVVAKPLLGLPRFQNLL